MTPTTLSAHLAGHFDPAPSTVDAHVRQALATLIKAKGFTLTGLARSMGRSHTWLLRKLDPDQDTTRPTTLEDVATVLAFLEASPADLELPAAA